MRAKILDYTVYKTTIYPMHIYISIYIYIYITYSYQTPSEYSPKKIHDKFLLLKEI